MEFPCTAQCAKDSAAYVWREDTERHTEVRDFFLVERKGQVEGFVLLQLSCVSNPPSQLVAQTT